MSTTTINSVTGKSTKVQKRIKAILVKMGLWRPEGVRLVYDILKCTKCQTFSTCGIFVRG